MPWTPWVQRQPAMWGTAAENRKQRKNHPSPWHEQVNLVREFVQNAQFPFSFPRIYHEISWFSMMFQSFKDIHRSFKPRFPTSSIRQPGISNRVWKLDQLWDALWRCPEDSRHLWMRCCGAPQKKHHLKCVKHVFSSKWRWWYIDAWAWAYAYLWLNVFFLLVWARAPSVGTSDGARERERWVHHAYRMFQKRSTEVTCLIIAFIYLILLRFLVGTCPLANDGKHLESEIGKFGRLKVTSNKNLRYLLITTQIGVAE